MFTPSKILEEKLQKMLAEDVGQGDITTALIVPSDTTAEAVVIAKEHGVAAGIEEGKILLKSLGLEVQTLVTDGEKIKDKQVLMRVSGNARLVLSTERTLINILSRMSGIATAARKLTEKIKEAGLKTRIACTRKTAPGLLYFDKKAVLVGGGDTHRLHLDDMILIKDNHIAVAGSVREAIKKVKEKTPFSKKIEVEAANIEDVLTAAKAGVDIIMMDNFSPKQIKRAIKLLRKTGFLEKVLLEASGGITTENLIDFASTGVNIVSLGEITDSPKTLDISLEVSVAKKKQASIRLT